MVVNSKIDIIKVTSDKEKIAEEFLLNQCKLHYGKRMNNSQIKILKSKLKKEFENEKSSIFIALENKNIIGSIVISEFDNRIKNLHARYQNVKTAEISRCYVDENFRRKGLGTTLFDYALKSAINSGFESLYLHTHYFLPGGFQFWKKMGFWITLDENDSWQTVHMERLVNVAICCA